MSGSALRWHLVRIASSPPAQLAVSLAEAKRQVRVEDDFFDDDLVLDSCIRAAIDELDGPDSWLGRALVSQSYRLTLDRFPMPERGRADARIRLPLPPIVAVAALDYIDGAGVSRTLVEGEDYDVFALADSAGFVAPCYGMAWPATRPAPDAVTVTYSAGWGAPADIPEPLRRWLLMRAGDYYAHREHVIVGGSVQQIDFAALSIMRYRRVVIP